LDDALEARAISEGMVGQCDARRAAGVIIKLIQAVNKYTHTPSFHYTLLYS